MQIGKSKEQGMWTGQIGHSPKRLYQIRSILWLVVEPSESLMIHAEVGRGDYQPASYKLCIWNS